jgi:hypothetical protein
MEPVRLLHLLSCPSRAAFSQQSSISQKAMAIAAPVLDWK